MEVGLGSTIGAVIGTPLGIELGNPLSSKLRATLGNKLGSVLGGKLGSKMGKLLIDSLGNALGSILGVTLGIKLGSILGIALGTELGIALVLKLETPLVIELGSELAETVGDGVGKTDGKSLGEADGISLELVDGESEADVVGVTEDDSVGEFVFLHLRLHNAGQKNLTFCLVPGCVFAHLLVGFSATYALHVLEEFPPYLNESEFSHGLRKTVGDDVGESVFLHFLLHVDGQKNLTFFPVPGCSFTHLLMGFFATYVSHVLEGLPSKRNNCEFSHLPRS